jgi:hypothetical protein
VTRPEHRDLLREPVPDEVRTGFGRVLLGMLVVFGAAVPVGRSPMRRCRKRVSSRSRTPPGWRGAGRQRRCSRRWRTRVRRVDSPYTTERRKLTELASAKYRVGTGTSAIRNPARTT